MSDENATGQGGEFSMEFVSPPDTAQQLQDDVGSIPNLTFVEPGPDTLRDALNAAKDGDELILGNGEYGRGLTWARGVLAQERAEVEDGPGIDLLIAAEVFRNELDAPTALLRADIVERRHVERTLAIVEGNKSHAARVLGFDRRTLYRKLARYAAADKKTAR